MESINTSSYSVHFNARGYEALNAHLQAMNYSRIFILVDENTHHHCLSIFMAKLEGNYHYEIIEIEAGEEHKNIDTCTSVWEALSELDGDRKSLLINLGGGVITDLGGFVASAFRRGIHFINIPTTLLAMVDASIGGKTGVDLGMLKNQIGVINQPQMVLIASEFLRTLERRQLQSGFAEMLKHGLIRDSKYWENLKQLNGFDTLDRPIYDSVVIKNDIVLQDPTEEHLRKILNFGHTLGHAIETHFLSGERGEVLLHGEAIAIGMILEGFLSFKLTGLPEPQLEDLKSTMLERYKKVSFTYEDVEQIVSLLKFDKKNSHGRINFVLLSAIGETEIDCQVPAELYEEAFAYYKE
ncbi:MAG: 3-dehydroquinate synthase [Flavobacteriaceae bacterium]